MICPRCGNKKVALMKNWPAMGVWTCDVCNKAWAEGVVESKARKTKRLREEGKGE